MLRQTSAHGGHSGRARTAVVSWSGLIKWVDIFVSLFLFCDDPNVRVFKPRPVRISTERPTGREWLKEPLVWAIGQGAELRVIESLVSLSEFWKTSLHVSGLRIRNARDWKNRDQAAE